MSGFINACGQHKLSRCLLMGFLVIAFSACSHKAIHNPATHSQSTQKDYLYLLEELNDGKLASWQDASGQQHRFAVFSTYTSGRKLCRDYFIITDAMPRLFGSSCRKSKNNWQYVEGSESTAHQHYLQFMRLESGFRQGRETSTSATQSGNRHGVNYPRNYQLSPFFKTISSKAEKKYRLPLASMIETTSQQENFHPCLLHSLVYHESGYNPKAATPCCYGLMQLSKAAAKESGVHNRQDPRQNLNGGARYLQQKLKDPGIDGNISLALASYNCGYGTIKNNHFKIPQRCWSNNPREYVKKILTKFQQCQ